MGKLEDEVTRDMAGMTKTRPPTSGGTVNLDGLDEDERLRMILARLDGVHVAVVRLARRLDQLG
jgi:hypothetical protein